MIAYERGGATRIAVREHVRAYGCPEVTFVGSSRVHIGIVCPEVASGIRGAVGREVSVGNFASGGALIQELLPTVRYALRHEPRPVFLMYGVDPEQIRGPELFNERSAIFCSMDDLRHARSELGIEAREFLPVVARNHAADWCVLFRYRSRPLNWLRERFKGRELSPVLGEIVGIEHSSDAGRTLLTDPPDPAEVRHHVETAHLDHGVYPFNPAKVEMFTQLARECRDHGVRLVFFEVPNARVFDQCLPPGVNPRFRELMGGVADQTGARFVTLDELGLSFTDEEFRDPVHLNLNGATRLSRALTERVIVPELIAAEAKRSREPAESR